MSIEPIDIPELMRVDLIAQLTALGALPTGGVVVAESTDAQNQAGVVVIAEAGSSQPELYAPIINGRIQVRTVSAQLKDAQIIGRNVFLAWHQKDRRLAVATTNGFTYLIHGSTCVAGPSQHYDTQETWEYLAFYTVKVGTQHV